MDHVGCLALGSPPAARSAVGHKHRLRRVALRLAASARRLVESAADLSGGQEALVAQLPAPVTSSSLAGGHRGRTEEATWEAHDQHEQSQSRAPAAEAHRLAGHGTLFAEPAGQRA